MEKEITPKEALMNNMDRARIFLASLNEPMTKTLYISTISENEIRFQGYYSAILSKELLKMGFSYKICDINGFVEYKKNDISITLT